MLPAATSAMVPEAPGARSAPGPGTFVQAGFPKAIRSASTRSRWPLLHAAIDTTAPTPTATSRERSADTRPGRELGGKRHDVRPYVHGRFGLLAAERVDGGEPGGAAGRVDAEDDADGEGDAIAPTAAGQDGDRVGRCSAGRTSAPTTRARRRAGRRRGRAWRPRPGTGAGSPAASRRAPCAARSRGSAR